MPNPPPPVTTDTAGRIVNAAVVLIALGIAAVAFCVLVGNKDTLAAGSSLFGGFTTLIGTAIAAYFGITATRDVANTSGAQLANAHDQLGDANGKLAAINSVVSNADRGAAHPASDQIRSIIAQ